MRAETKLIYALRPIVFDFEISCGIRPILEGCNVDRHVTGEPFGAYLRPSD